MVVAIHTTTNITVFSSRKMQGTKRKRDDQSRTAASRSARTASYARELAKKITLQMETFLEGMSVELAMRNVPHVGTGVMFEKCRFLNEPGKQPGDLQKALVVLDNPKNTVCCLHDLITEQNAEIAAKNAELTAQNAELTAQIAELKKIHTVELKKIHTANQTSKTNVNAIYETIIRNILTLQKKREGELLTEIRSHKKRYQFCVDIQNKQWDSSYLENNVMIDLIELYKNKSNATVEINVGQYQYRCFYDDINDEFVQENMMTHTQRYFRLIDHCTSSLPEEYVRKMFNTPIQMSDLLAGLGGGDPNEITNRIAPSVAFKYKNELESSDIVALGELYSKDSLQKKYDSKKSEIWVRALTMLNFFEWCIRDEATEFVIGFHGSSFYNSIKEVGFSLKHAGLNGSLRGPGYYLSLGTDTIPHDYSENCSNESSYAKGSVIMCLVPINIINSSMDYYNLETKTMKRTPGPLDTGNNVCKAVESCYFLPLGILAHIQEQKTQ